MEIESSDREGWGTTASQPGQLGAGSLRFFLPLFFASLLVQFYEDGEDGSRKSSSTYLKEVMGKWESNSHMAKSAERFGGQPKTDDEEPPTVIDEQTAPPN